MDVFVSWSGGKDCNLACYRAINKGLNVRYLVSMITEDNGRLCPHHLSHEVLTKQAEAIGIPLIQCWTTVSDYKDKFINTINDLKREGVTGGVFGDVSIGNDMAQEHRNWDESACLPLGIVPYLPLWNESREEMFENLIDLGFEAIIIAAENKRLGPDWLGRTIDRELLSELKLRHDLSPTGEVGNYHTLVVDGPIFKKRLEILDSSSVRNNGMWYLDIKDTCLTDKSYVRDEVFTRSSCLSPV